MPSPKRIRLRDLRKSPGFVTHEQLASVIDAVVLIDEQTGGGGGGAAWFDGAGTPSPGLGNNGDYYLNTTNGDVYEKAGGSWSVVGNIKGPSGNNGTNGVGVPVAGTAGQILAKINSTDYNTEWIDNFTSQVKHEVKAGVALIKGQAVYVTGSTGGSGTNMIVGKSDNSTESQSSKTIGLIAQNLAINGFGYVITEGLLAGLDTSAAGSAGDPVWLGTNGNLLYGISNKPSAPAHMVFIGIVTRKQSVNGEIFVRVQNGFELKEIHDVQAQSPTLNDTLYYDNMVSPPQWKTGQISSIATEATQILSGIVNTVAQTFGGIKTFGNGANAGQIRLLEPSANGTDSVGIKAQAMAASYDLTMPANVGTSGNVLQTDGSGVLSWVNNGGSQALQYRKNTLATTLVNPSSNTILESILIPGGTFKNNDAFVVTARITGSTGTSLAGNISLGINTSNTLTGGGFLNLFSSSLGTGTSSFNGVVGINLYGGLGGNVTRIISNPFTSAVSIGSSTTIINWNLDQYLIHYVGANNNPRTYINLIISVTPI